MEKQGTSQSVLRDVIVIGAGPAGLAVAARLAERTPSAIFTDEEHRRYHWLRNRSSRVPYRRSRDGVVVNPFKPLSPPDEGDTTGTSDGTPSPVTTTTTTTSLGPDILVLDAEGGSWMSRWKRLFKTFDITFLRSPMFFHVDPHDRDGLLAFAHETGRDGEVLEVKGCVGKEVSKHRKKKKRSKSIQCQPRVIVDERDRKDYYNPSRELFWDHCTVVAKRYHLGPGMVQHEEARDIDFGLIRNLDPEQPVFTVTTDKGVHHARVVVMAVGPANQAVMPGMAPGDRHPGACHSMHTKSIPDPLVAAKIAAGKVTNVVVVGGGLVSSQIVDLAVRRGVTKVWHLMRGPLKVKPFDIDLSWLSKFRNLEHASFWSAETDEDRLDLILKARNGGSLTARFLKIERGHLDSGRATMHTFTSIVDRQWDAETGTWTIRTDPPIPDLPPIDYIHYATGVKTDFAELPMLQTMLQKHPIPGVGGFPCLNDDLMWTDDIPLYANGRLAALRLGPGAHNLVGARAGAERVAWSVEEYLTGPDPAGLHSNSHGPSIIKPTNRARNPKIVTVSQHRREVIPEQLDQPMHAGARQSRTEMRAEKRDLKVQQQEEQFLLTKIQRSLSKVSLSSDDRFSATSSSSGDGVSSVQLDSNPSDDDEDTSYLEESIPESGELKRQQKLGYVIGNGSRFEALSVE